MISKRIVGLFSLVAAIATLAVLFFPSSNANAREPGMRVEGAWYGSFEPQGYPPFRFLANLMRDGNIVTSDGTDFVNGFQTTTTGSWVRTSERGIAVTLLALNFDPAGNYVAASRTRGTGQLSADGHELSGVFVTDYFLPDQDPLDPDAVPYDSVSATFAARRIRAL